MQNMGLGQKDSRQSSPGRGSEKRTVTWKATSDSLLEDVGFQDLEATGIQKREQQ